MQAGLNSTDKISPLEEYLEALANNYGETLCKNSWGFKAISYFRNIINVWKMKMFFFSLKNKKQNFFE